MSDPGRGPDGAGRAPSLRHHPMASGLVLMACALLALVLANSPASALYFGALRAHVGGASVQGAINDGLMTVFFLLVGLEIKRELVEGELSSWRQRALPGLCAAGGMVVPAAVYAAINLRAGGVPRGWAIPVATDIAFALGVLALVGPAVPRSLKVFLTALAIIDDLGAVLVIATFYSGGLDRMALGAAAVVVAMLWALHRRNVSSLLPYLLLGALLWCCLRESGVHATLAGVILALAIPLRVRDGAARVAPFARLEHALRPWVAFLVLPLFGLANAGVDLSGALRGLVDAVPLGIALGLFAGKQAGVFAMAALAIRCGAAPMPAGASWRSLHGIAVLCGIGFTMSLFIGQLAFAHDPAQQAAAKVGVLAGSLLSALLGAWLLRRSASSGMARQD